MTAFNRNKPFYTTLLVVFAPHAQVHPLNSGVFHVTSLFHATLKRLGEAGNEATVERL